MKVSDRVRETTACECLKGAEFCFHRETTITRIVTPDPRHNDPPYAWLRNDKRARRRIPLDELALDY